MYKYIYYKFYKFAIITEKGWKVELRMPQGVAFFTLFLFFTFNIGSIIFLYTHFTTKLLNIENWHVFTFAFSFFVPNYFMFLYKNKYLAVAKKFDSQSWKDKIVKEILFWVYFLLTIVSFVLAVSL